MKEVFIPDVVQDIIRFYGSILPGRSQFSTIKDHLFSLSAKMWEGIRNDVPCIKTQFNNYHPDYLGLPLDSPVWKGLTFRDCQHAIASEYGFKDWPEIEEAANTVYDENLQAAIDHLLNGNIENLKMAIAKDEGILHRPTQYGHRARLIHYCGSNGIEIWRQKVPYQLPEMIEFLKEQGIDMDATMMVYGGEHGVKDLASTSVHPEAAGIREKLLEVLKC